MDIDSLFTADIHDEGAEMQVYDQFNNPTEMYIRLAGQDSEIWQKASRERSKRALKQLVSKEIVSDDDTEIDEMVNASLGWRGFEQDNKEMVFSKGAIKQLYAKAPYIKDQAILFVNNRANFIKS